MNRLRLLAAVAVLCSAAAVGTAAAQQNPAPAKPPAEKGKASKPERPQKGKAPEKAPAAGTGERFDDWRLGCERLQDSDRGACFVEQRVSRKDAPDRLALAVAVGYFAPGGKPAMVIKIPPSAIKEAGIIIKVDDRPIREVGIRSCGPDNCSIMALLDDDLMSEMRGGKTAIVAYSPKESEEVVRVPLSLKGLTRGLAALQKL